MSEQSTSLRNIILPPICDCFVFYLERRSKFEFQSTALTIKLLDLFGIGAESIIIAELIPSLDLKACIHVMAYIQCHVVFSTIV